MTTAPEYFERVRSNAESRWTQLEADPELAGPWHRLFQQVQSPRHVLSELLQNADDADATWASVSIEGDSFIFSHNGRDFSDDEFGSLCRFGYSNKRALHTIGFRGVGFKSAFSLGDEVRVLTPTVRVLFRKSRFTEPIWMEEPCADSTTTRIEVELRDAGVRKQVAGNLQDWLSSPASLLFFSSIRSLQIEDTELRWQEIGPGPLPESHWLRLGDDEQKPVLLIHSQPEAFPEDALAEIEAERILGEGEHLQLPPCTVDLLLGEDKRLFVVLPTGVKTELPFAINAPFVQDTARLKVKDPDTSPTNRWLLERAGRLAADAMLAWVNGPEEPFERAKAYVLMPDVDREATSLDGSSAAVVELSFAASIENRPFVLTESGRLAEDGNASSLPDGLLDIWTLSETTRLFSPEGREIASSAISNADLEKLHHWNAVKAVGREQVVERLKATHPRKPQSWRELLRLWSYLAHDIPSYHWYGNDVKGIHVAPIQGGNELFAANTVVRLGEKRLLAEGSDWEFLSTHLRVLNPNWGRFLAEQRKIAEERNDSGLSQQVGQAYRLMSHLQLEEASDTSLVVKRVSTAFFAQESIKRSECVRLAQIAAKLGAAVGPEFKFVAKDSKLRASSVGIVADENGQIEDVVPAEWAEKRILHSDYWREWTSCTRDEWLDWVNSGRSELFTAPPIGATKQTFWSRAGLDSTLKEKGFEGNYDPHYKTEHFELHDSDFETSLWQHWNEAAERGEPLWTDVFRLILSQRASYWEKFLGARVQHVATTGSKRQIIGDGITSTWILKFRELPCLRDSRAIPRKPFEVLRRTPQTEALLDVEPFLPAEVDTESNRPLFNALRVRKTPSGPEQILQRIQALSESDNPPLDELDKWYRKLDSLLPSCTTADAAAVTEAFESEELIYSAAHGWLKSGEVFLSASEDDMPDAPVIRHSVHDLSLWRRVNVADRPNFSRILDWLNELPNGEPVGPDTSKRIRSALGRFPDAIWTNTGHWLNLAGQWVETETLKYSLSLRSLTKSQDLFPAIRQATADFQMLSHEQQDREPFSLLPSLASSIEERIPEETVRAFEILEKPWLQRTGNVVARIVLSSDEETAKVQSLGRRLSRTTWLEGKSLQTIPYLDGTPVGPPRRVPAVWSDCKLFVESGPTAALAGPVAKELARPFDNLAIADGIKFAFERDAQFIEGYFEQEFKLAEQSLFEEVPPAESPTQKVPAVDSKEAPESQATKSQETDIEGSGEADAPRTDGPADSSSGAQPHHDSRGSGEDRQRPQRPALIERYAAAEGFSKNGDGIFKSPDGRRLIRSESSPFPWEIRDNTGALIQALLPQEHCLERDSIMIDSEVWGLLQNPNSTHALLLIAPDSTPSVLTGKEVAAAVSEGRIALFPAKYRLSKAH